WLRFRCETPRIWPIPKPSPAFSTPTSCPPPEPPGSSLGALLRLADQLAGLDLQDDGELLDGCQRWALQPALELADVGPVEFRLEPEFLLREVELLPAGADGVAEGLLKAEGGA